MYVNRELALKYVGGIQKIYINLCRSFLVSYADYEERVRKAYPDGSELFELVHSLKGISLNLGAEQLYEMTKDNHFEDLEDFIRLFNATYSEIDEMIKKEIA